MKQYLQGARKIHHKLDAKRMGELVIVPKLDDLRTDELRRATFLLTDEIYDAFRLKCLLEGKQLNDFARRLFAEHIEERYFKQINESRAATKKKSSTEGSNKGSKQLIGEKNETEEEIEEL